ncbi:hypothetical protein EDB83DRAFT_2526560 [Lactarius deliciosus]|nr:hypothetical protein EDB83DRAFT_2526560 [Lactarius deliciosus]
MALGIEKPKCAAMVAALKYPVWLNGKASGLASGEQKRHRSPDRSSATLKKAHKDASKEKLLPKMANISAHATPQRSQCPPVISRRDPVQIDMESDQDVDLVRDDGTDNSSGDNRNKPESDDEDELGEDKRSEDQEHLIDLEPSVIRAMFGRVRAKWGTSASANADDNIASGSTDNDPYTICSVLGSHRLKEAATKGVCNASGDEDHSQDHGTSKGDHNGDAGAALTKLTIGKRAADRLAEVPQWEDHDLYDLDATCYNFTSVPILSVLFARPLYFYNTIRFDTLSGFWLAPTI